MKSSKAEKTIDFEHFIPASDYDNIVYRVCTEFCFKQCTNKIPVNNALTGSCFFCQDIYDALVYHRLLRNDEYDDILKKFVCKCNAERLTSKEVFDGKKNQS